VEELSDTFAPSVAGSPEDSLTSQTGQVGGGVAPGETSGAMAPASMGKQEALNRFSTDLTEKARKGEIDPIVGRDEETRQIVDILMRRRQNNPILTGEAGVGKTAVVEGFALRIASGDVPPALKDVVLRTLDLGLLQAGASMKGEFEEPSEERAVLMIRGLSPVLEKHHKVDGLDEALVAAAQLSHRYIPARQLPDKAVSLIDTACARVAISQHATPPEVEDSKRRLSALQTELEILDRESAVGINHEARRAEIAGKLEEENSNLKRLDEHWKQEKEAVDKILNLRQKLRSPSSGNGAEQKIATTEAQGKETRESGGKPQLLATLRALENELATLQGETPLVFPSVDEQAVASVVADWTGIPVGRMVKNEIQAVLSLADNLEKRVIGQRHALEAISRRIQTSRAQLDNPGKPIGVFLLAGPSGVGKTETALALAETLYGGESNLITINMSEFQEAHTVSTLKGAPPGYVGYGEGGILTEAVRRRPYSVVLLDEVEKAHSDVHEIFFQVFDKGMMEDGEGRLINFKNTIILLTTNVGTDLIMNLCKDPELKPDVDGM